MTNAEITARFEALPTEVIRELLEEGPLGPRAQQIGEDVLATRSVSGVPA